MRAWMLREWGDRPVFGQVKAGLLASIDRNEVPGRGAVVIGPGLPQGRPPRTRRYPALFSPATADPPDLSVALLRDGRDS